MGSLIEFQQKENLAIVCLNRPDALNALSRELVSHLTQLFRELSERSDLRAIVMSGRGRAFCVGVDLKEMSESDVVSEQFAWHGPDSLFSVVRSCPHPIISAVNGYAITGGLELALLGDFMIASDKAVFADTHARVGITPSWGMTQVLPRLVGINRARQMSLTGEFVSADKALDWGLVNEVVPPEALMDRAVELATQIVGTDAVTMRRIRGLIAEGAELPLDKALQLEIEVFDRHMSSVSASNIAEGRERATQRGRQMAESSKKEH